MDTVTWKGVSWAVGEPITGAHMDVVYRLLQDRRESQRLELTVSAGLFERVESARGDVSRASFVRRALESALGGVPPERAEEPALSSGRSASAPIRTSEDEMVRQFKRQFIPEGVDRAAAFRGRKKP